MEIVIVIVLIVVAILSYFIYQSLPSTKFKKACSLFDAAKLTEAITILESIFSRHPKAPAKFAECKLEQGRQLKPGNVKDAKACFNEVIDTKKRLPGNADKAIFELIEAKAFYEIAGINLSNASAGTDEERKVKELKDNLQYIDTATKAGMEDDFDSLRKKHFFELAELNFSFGIRNEKSRKLIESIEYYSIAKDFAAKAGNTKILYNASARIEICKLKQLSVPAEERKGKKFSFAIGIHFGERYCAVAFKDQAVRIIRNKENEELTRSCVGFRKGEILVGRPAFLNADPHNTILSIRRLIGRNISDRAVQDMMNSNYYKFAIKQLANGTKDAVAVVLGGKEYTPEQISSFILKKLKEDAEERLNDEVTDAVITIPAYFTEKQKNATKIAAQLAGLKVKRLLAEPTAAAIAFGVDNLGPGDSRTVLIYDFGGGTFDLSILNIADGQYLEAGTGGDHCLGGDDLDRALQGLILERISGQYKFSDINKLIRNLPDKKRFQFEGQLRYKTEEAKIQLSSSQSTNIVMDGLEDENGEWIEINVTVTRKEFEGLIAPFVQRSIDLIDTLLKEVGYDITMIDSILLVGSASSIPLIRQMLSEEFGADKISVSDQPTLAIVKGAAILAHRLGDEYEAPVGGTAAKTEIPYSANHNYYIEVAADDNRSHELIIEKQIPLPVEVARDFKTTSNNQKIFKVGIYADVEDGKLELQALGYYLIEDNLPIASDLNFQLYMDENENLNVTVYPKGKKNLAKQIVLGRGNADHKALAIMDELLCSSSKELKTPEAKETFLLFISEIFEEINAKGAANIDDNRWHEIYYTTTEKYAEIKNNEHVA